jgi:type IV pilus assembly protein PilC
MSASLATFCRSCRQLLEAGLPAARVIRQMAERGPRELRSTAAGLAARLERGQSLTDALASEGKRLPRLFVALVAVGEETGKLPEVFEELEGYFDQQRALRRAFLGMIAWPVFQFVVAVFILAGLITVLGVLGKEGQANPIRVFGLQGPGDALLFLLIVAACVALPWIVIHLLRRRAGGSPALDAFLLGVPLLGPALAALAVGRFSLSLALTLDAGVPIARALRLSLGATGNAAFAGRAEECARVVERGGSLEKALREHGRFDEVYLSIVATAEITGTEPATLKKQAKLANETAGLKLRLLATAAGVLVWIVVAVFILTAIVRIFSTYVGLIDSMVP